MLSPMTAAAARISCERAAGDRVRRLMATASDGARQRLRPTRPRMRALTVVGGGKLEWRSVPAPPPPGPLGAVVRPLAVATCDLDRALVLGATPFPFPLRYGHECIAEVLSVGASVANIRPGQRVVVPFQISCGTCAACTGGRTGNCTSVPPLSMYGFGLIGGHWGGAVADQLAVPFADGMLVPLSDGLEPAHVASVADNVCDGYRHIGPYLPSLLDERGEVEVIILAAVSSRSLFSASVPLYAGLTARALGASAVHFVDCRPEVRVQAARLGLNALAPGDLRRGFAAPLTADVTGQPSGLRRALSLTAPDGICSSVGGLHRSGRLPIGEMYMRNATLSIGRTHARAVMPAVLDLITSGRLQPERVTTTVAPMDDAVEVLRAHMLGDSTKTILTA